MSKPMFVPPMTIEEAKNWLKEDADRDYTEQRLLDLIEENELFLEKAKNKEVHITKYVKKSVMRDVEAYKALLRELREKEN